MIFNILKFPILHPFNFSIIQFSKPPNIHASKPARASAGFAKPKQSARRPRRRGRAGCLPVATHQKGSHWPPRCPPRQPSWQPCWPLFFDLFFNSVLQFGPGGPKVQQESVQFTKHCKNTANMQILEQARGSSGSPGSGVSSRSSAPPLHTRRSLQMTSVLNKLPQLN